LLQPALLAFVRDAGQEIVHERNPVGVPDVVPAEHDDPWRVHRPELPGRRDDAVSKATASAGVGRRALARDRSGRGGRVGDDGGF
jgi:hypothetical protein